MQQEPNQDSIDRQEREDQKGFTSVGLIKLSVLFYVVGVVAAVILVSGASDAQKTTVLAAAMVAFIGGAQKIIGMLQVHNTDRTVNRDLQATRSVASTLNGGYNERVKGIVRDVLAEELPKALADAMAKHQNRGGE